MKCLCQARAAYRRWGGIYLVDKFLLCILALLMLQSAINLFLRGEVTAEVNGIDALMRTSAAGIFGYLVSANFNQHRKRGAEGRVDHGNAPPQMSDGTLDQIGFRAEGGEAETAAVPAPPAVTQAEQGEGQICDRAQVMVVASIGLVSFFILMVLRTLMPAGEVNSGSLTQFRDFASGSVGFLISCSTSGVGGKEK